MADKSDVNAPDGARDSAEYADALEDEVVSNAELQKNTETTGEFLFQVFCAVIFLGMIGLVFYNAMLRYIFSSSYPPSEEWARFLFIYITFFGSIEAFYRKKHIAVDMFVDLFHGAKRKYIDIFASICGMGAMFLLLWGGIIYLTETYNTSSIVTNVNMTFIYGTLPIMAAASLICQIRDFIALLKRPVSSFEKEQDRG